jgi:transcriptional regulator with XRE-family HTH domain
MWYMDTRKITCELIGTGLTQQALAALIPCSQSTISSFLSGSRGVRPSLFIGTRLLELHKERVEIETGAGRRKDDPPPPAASPHRHKDDPAAGVA